MDQAKLPRRMADGISPLLLLFCLVLTLETGICNLFMSECLAEEDRSFQIKCTDRLNENNSFVIWTTRDGTTSKSIPVSRCPSEQHKCLNWRPESFTALTLRNKTHFETQLAISKVTPSQRDKEFKCAQFSKTSQITRETQSCTLKTYLLPVSPTCKEEQRGEELYIECETAKVHPQLMCKLYLLSSNSSASSHDDSVLLVETVNMATKNQDIYQNGSKYFKASCSYLLKQLPSNTVNLRVEMYPYIEGENMEKFSTQIPLNFSSNRPSGPRNTPTDKEHNGTKRTPTTESEDRDDKILLYIVVGVVALLLVASVIFVVCLIRHKCAGKDFFTGLWKSHSYTLPTDMSSPSSNHYLNHNDGRVIFNLRSTEADHNSVGSIDIDNMPSPYTCVSSPCQIIRQGQNRFYVNCRAANGARAELETRSTGATINTGSSFNRDTEASSLMLGEDRGHTFETVTIASQFDDTSLENTNV